MSSLSLSPGGNGDLGSVMQLWERCKPRGPVTVHRCGVLTSSWWQQSQGALECVRARTYGSVFPAWGQKFVNGCRDCQHAWNSSRLQTTGDKFGGSKERGRGSLAKVFHSARAGETFPKIKGLLFFFTAMIYGEAQFGQMWKFGQTELHLVNRISQKEDGPAFILHVVSKNGF